MHLYTVSWGSVFFSVGGESLVLFCSCSGKGVFFFSKTFYLPPSLKKDCQEEGLSEGDHSQSIPLRDASLDSQGEVGSLGRGNFFFTAKGGQVGVF